MQRERAERHENERFGEESMGRKCKVAEEEGANRAAVFGKEINNIKVTLWALDWQHNRKGAPPQNPTHLML